MITLSQYLTLKIPRSHSACVVGDESSSNGLVQCCKWLRPHGETSCCCRHACDTAAHGRGCASARFSRPGLVYVDLDAMRSFSDHTLYTYATVPRSWCTNLLGITTSHPGPGHRPGRGCTTFPAFGALRSLSTALTPLTKS